MGSPAEGAGGWLSVHVPGTVGGVVMLVGLARSPGGRLGTGGVSASWPGSGVDGGQAWGTGGRVEPPEPALSWNTLQGSQAGRI